MSLFSRIAEEARGFRAAYEGAPEPQVTRDVLGLRRMMRKLGWLLLREHVEPRRLAAAVFVGVMIGASPFYLLHTALVLLFAFALRLNKLAVWVASNVSLPFLAPFLTFVSMQLGHGMLHGSWLPVTLAGIRAAAEEGGALRFGAHLWGYWLLGSPITGGVLGAVLAGLTYAAALRRPAWRTEESA